MRRVPAVGRVLRSPFEGREHRREGRPAFFIFYSASKERPCPPAPPPRGETELGSNLTTKRGRTREGMAGQRPWARETPSGVTERGATELYGTGGRGPNTRRRSGERTPHPPQPPSGAGASEADRARGPRAPRPGRRRGQAPRPASRCPSQLLTRARPCAPGPRQPLRRLISQLFKSQAVSAPISQEAGAPFPDERRRSDERRPRQPLADRTPAPSRASVGQAGLCPCVPRGARLLRPGPFAAN